MSLDDDLMKINVSDDTTDKTDEVENLERLEETKEQKIENLRQAVVDCQGDRQFTDIGMDDEFWSLQNQYHIALSGE